jgi:hypothetical protein
MQFMGDTQVLANDGLGTNVLRLATNGTYWIVDFRPGYKKNQILPFSSTHSNETRWYNKRTVHVNWLPLAGAEEYLYAFDQRPDTAPSGDLYTTGTEVDFNAAADGVYYFHIIPKMTSFETVPESASELTSVARKQYNFRLVPVVGDLKGQTAHLKIMVDTTPPNPPVINASAMEVAVGEIVRFSFFDQGDNMSGIKNGFYVQFGDGIWLPTSAYLNMPFLEKGKFTVGARVFDKAGNFSDSEIKITVR